MYNLLLLYIRKIYISLQYQLKAKIMSSKNWIKIEQVEPLFRKGLSYQQIANELGVKKQSIGFFCRRHFGKLEDRGKFVRNNASLTQIQKEIIFGSLLGDCNIHKHRNSYEGRVNHCIKQLSYAEYMRTSLGDICSDMRFVNKSLNSKIYQQCSFDIKNNFALKELYDLFYYKGRKDIPIDLSLLTPRALAFWFMDDGSKSSKHSIEIATCSFSLNGLLRMQSFLEERYNIKSIIRKDFRLYICTESSSKFKNLVLPYIHKSMMYKLSNIRD